MNKINKITRRRFIGSTAVAATGIIAVPTIISSCAKGANSRLMLAHIGVGSRGQDELFGYFVPKSLNSCSVVTCDTYKDRRESTAARVNELYKKAGIVAPECKPILHFEEILQRSDIDAVVINTPDHWHLPIAIHAARAKKHVMLAKPLGLSYADYLILKKELEDNDVRFHYATQHRSMRHFQLGIELIRSGEIGEIQRIDVWAPGQNPVENPQCIEMPVPEGFDFDKWTGPAPLNTYCPERVTNNASWFQWDYSIGFLAGWGAHPLDVMVWAAKEKLSGQYSCFGNGKYWEPNGIYNNILSWDLNYKYDSGLEMHFFSTDLAETANLLHYREKKEGNGTTFFGTKGWISLSRNSAQSDIASINTRINEFPKNDNGWIKSEEGTLGLMFTDVVSGKIKETCPLEDAIISDTVSHAGNMAIRTSRNIAWNPVKGEVTGDPDAMKWFIREHRKPYIV